MCETLSRHREIWDKKKILREIYAAWYRMILGDMKESGHKTVELGAGSGNFKAFKPDVISADIADCEWLDMCFDAHHMPFENNTLGNIVMVDVLHHLADPVRFFNEAYRVLEPQGRLIMLEPYPSLLSRPVYRAVHPEPFLMNMDYFDLKPGRAKKDPWAANQAIPYLMFFKQRRKFEKQFEHQYRIIKRERNSCVLYPASGGFERRALIPDFMIPVFRILELLLKPLSRIMAFRCYVVLEKI